MLVGTCALFGVLLGCVCWIAHVPVLTAVTYPTVQQLAGAIVVSVLLAYLLIDRPWR